MVKEFEVRFNLQFHSSYDYLIADFKHSPWTALTRTLLWVFEETSLNHFSIYWWLSKCLKIDKIKLCVWSLLDFSISFWFFKKWWSYYQRLFDHLFQTKTRVGQYQTIWTLFQKVILSETSYYNKTIERNRSIWFTYYIYKGLRGIVEK